jgi:hypothetical protein
MAFGGSITTTQINDRTVRITGATLAAANTSGTIGLSGATGSPPDITLPATFAAAAYTYQGNPVALVDAIDININMISNGALTNLMPSVQKTGTTPADFRITIVNTSASLTTQTMEIVVTFKVGQVGEPARIS